MHPALRRPSYNTIIMVRQGMAFTRHLKRIYMDKADNIKLPPEPTTCCMSGCANCVWIEYAQTISKILDGNSEKVKEIVLSKITDPNLKMFLTLELRNLQTQNPKATEMPKQS
ncbi:oxidoreductase-like domain-containing protein 1 [Teleopsis dalmanni]|uniref:oxidoreductase-like domain-containing protein 1 n=1 Tax=Teleopsis dalmanni TaxID=139649 RepID=UPI0018CD7BB4|nr:oxidoreductase-like domain-containing protein 1 [Teleopsis dalmanni]XP_037953619.1 oxidoreductase-like domain-containing protein 1 [Teleopsis dalmanni]